MSSTCSYIVVKGVDTPFSNNYSSEQASSALESCVCQKNVRCCKALADKYQNLLTDTSRICHFGKQLADQAIYLLLHVRDMKYTVCAKT